MKSKLCISKRLVVLSTVLLFVIVGTVTVSFFVSHKQNILQNRAAENNTVMSDLVRSVSSDTIADIILGHDDFTSVIPKEIVPFKLSGPGGVYVDKQSKPNRVYIFDGMNSRVLGYKNIGTCKKTNSPCSTDLDCPNSSASIDNYCNVTFGTKGGKEPDIVFGQKSAWGLSACNKDGSFQHYPERALAGPDTICSMDEKEVSYFEGGSAAGMAVDSEGNFYFPDSFNHRILKYNKPFETDTVADEVWGQSNFTHNACNEGTTANSTSLCFLNSHYAKPAVTIDQKGNLWVADVGNNRVLRFSYDSATKVIAKKADLVLGQGDFLNREGDPGINRLNAPNAVKVDSQGNVLVSDYLNNRVLIYPFPQSTGMMATVFTNLSHPNGIEFIDDTGKVVISAEKTLEVFTYNKKYPIDAQLDVKKMESMQAWESYGSIGVLENKTIISSNSENAQNIAMYNWMYNRQDYTSNIMTYFDLPSEVMGYDKHNYIEKKGFQSLRGVVATDTQVIVADAHRLAFWDTPNGIADLTNGKPIDGYFGVDEGKQFSVQTYLRVAKGEKFIWALTYNIDNPALNSIQKYSLPIKNNQKPEEVVYMNDLNVVNNAFSIAKNTIIAPSDIYVNEAQEYMWLALPLNDRIIRVRIPGKKYSTYTIDAIIGGKTIPDRTLGWQLECRSHPEFPQSLCYPGSLNVDKLGNLYISDYMIEQAGSGRFFIFNNEKLPLNDSLLVLDTSQASFVHDKVYGWKPAFNSQNVMALGFSAWDGSRFPQIYFDIRNNPNFVADMKLKDFYAQAFAADFDKNDNLYIVDLNRGSLYIYKKPFFSSTSPLYTPAPKTTTATPRWERCDLNTHSSPLAGCEEFCKKSGKICSAVDESGSYTTCYCD